MASQKTKILILAHREGLGPIFSSVYLRPAKCLHNMGFEMRVSVFSALGEWLRPRLLRRWRIFERAARSYVPTGITRLPSPPNRWRNIWDDSVVFGFWMKSQSAAKRPEIIHCGSATAACIALDYRAKNPSIGVVYHAWGPESAEILFHKKQGSATTIDATTQLLADAGESRQARAMQEADVVISISRVMTHWALANYTVEKNSIVEIPCFVDTDYFYNQAKKRQEIRSTLCFDKKYVVAYCGSILPWQLIPEALDVLRILIESSDDIVFFALTTSPASMQKILEENNFPPDKVLVMSVSAEQVPSYLSSADLGVVGRGLMQAKTIVNEVSSPIKFGEYLACGVPVVMSEGVGDFSALTRTEKIGVVLPTGVTHEIAATLLSQYKKEYNTHQETIRKRCQAIAKRELSMLVHIETMATAYRKINEKK